MAPRYNKWFMYRANIVSVHEGRLLITDLGLSQPLEILEMIKSGKSDPLINETPEDYFKCMERQSKAKTNYRKYL
ncbi:hypothetical protein Glove_606g83 [Diversispora epigaea]|uniref:Uncharacterized protein n=1 Tax=Diversispora epigaea TaxID=1348612 RepID=A0A397G6Y3_9GLOM|nr:hypothetical protein Glove_606g83 [Diversispora epigaea]